jgi:hypothetical protein
VRFQETNKHWLQYFSVISLLLASGRKNQVIIALMATESFFRPKLHRLAEVFCWLVLDILHSERSKYISVGISQVQVRHWHSAGIISGSDSRVSIMLKFFSPFQNYDMCKYFIEMSGIQYGRTESIVYAYSGKTTKYHSLIFKHFLNLSKRPKKALARDAAPRCGLRHTA